MGHEHPSKELLKGLRLNDPSSKRQFEEIMTGYFGDSPPDRLHHYTSAEGLLGIITQEKMRASLLTHLNDSKELVLGQELIWSRAGNKWPSALGKAPDPREVWANIYAACFSADGDDLGQWRGYSGARGYCLTFDTSKLPDKMLLCKVRYEGEHGNVDERLKNAMDGLLAFYRKIEQAQQMDDVRKALLRGLALAAAVYKPSGFSAEREWRMTFWCDSCPDLDFRHRDGRIVPFHHIMLGSRLPLTEIMIGPGFDANLERSALQVLLRKYGLEGVQIETTKLSFRPQ